MKSIENDQELALGARNQFEAEIALYEKRHVPGDIVAIVAVPDFYHVAFPNIGHQIVEYEINQIEGFFAYRCYLQNNYKVLREATLAPDLIILSMSYEGSYIRSLRILDELGIAPLRSDRRHGDPIIVLGGRAVSMNPLPFFLIADVIGIGDSDTLIHSICHAYKEANGVKAQFEDRMVLEPGVVVPNRYVVDTGTGYLEKWEARNAPNDITANRGSVFPHSWYLSSETDYNDIGYYEGKRFFSMEIVKGCQSKCRFCAAGYNDGQMRFMKDVAEIIRRGQWAKGKGADLVKLFFPANSSVDTTKDIVRGLLEAGLSPRVGSAKAEKIDEDYINLVGAAGQEKFAIAPETGDYDLRARLGKPGMTDARVHWVMEKVIGAGIPNLDFYFIMNLPGETGMSFPMTIDFVGELVQVARRSGVRGRVRISAPNFFPKAWTPFQYAKSGGIDEYHVRIALLHRAFENDITISSMKDNVDLLSQNIGSRGGIEVGQLMMGVYSLLKAREQSTGAFTPDSFQDWRDAMSEARIPEERYFAERDPRRPLPWHHIKMYEDPPGTSKEHEYPVQKLAELWIDYNTRSEKTLASVFPIII